VDWACSSKQGPRHRGGVVCCVCSVSEPAGEGSRAEPFLGPMYHKVGQLEVAFHDVSRGEQHRCSICSPFAAAASLVSKTDKTCPSPRSGHPNLATWPAVPVPYLAALTFRSKAQMVGRLRRWNVASLWFLSKPPESPEPLETYCHRVSPGQTTPMLLVLRTTRQGDQVCQGCVG
jgi:hypothetical protein